MAVRLKVCSHCRQRLARENPETVHEELDLCCLIGSPSLQSLGCVVAPKEPCCRDFGYRIDRYTDCHASYRRHMGFDHHISAFDVCTLLSVKNDSW